MSTQEICLSTEHDLQDIDTLLCSAHELLSQSFRASEKRLKRLEWLQEKLAHNLLWVIRDDDGLAGVLILEQDCFERVKGIAYIIVTERMRGKKTIGPRLVQKAQTLASTGFLERRRGTIILGGYWKDRASKRDMNVHLQVIQF